MASSRRIKERGETSSFDEQSVDSTDVGDDNVFLEADDITDCVTVSSVNCCVNNMLVRFIIC